MVTIVVTLATLPPLADEIHPRVETQIKTSGLMCRKRTRTRARAVKIPGVPGMTRGDVQNAGDEGRLYPLYCGNRRCFHARAFDSLPTLVPTLVAT